MEDDYSSDDDDDENDIMAWGDIASGPFYDKEFDITENEVNMLKEAFDIFKG